jgi:hypothetical protein
MLEHRRCRRRRALSVIQVFDAITGEAIGHIGDLSVEGMLLVSNRAVPDDALFQVMFSLPRDGAQSSHDIEIGVHEQWSEATSFPGQYWAGFRIIDISPPDYRLLAEWVSRPGGQFG